MKLWVSVLDTILSLWIVLEFTHCVRILTHCELFLFLKWIETCPQISCLAPLLTSFSVNSTLIPKFQQDSSHNLMISLGVPLAFKWGIIGMMNLYSLFKSFPRNTEPVSSNCLIISCKNITKDLTYDLESDWLTSNMDVIYDLNHQSWRPYLTIFPTKRIFTPC